MIEWCRRYGALSGLNDDWQNAPRQPKSKKRHGFFGKTVPPAPTQADLWECLCTALAADVATSSDDTQPTMLVMTLRVARVLGLAPDEERLLLVAVAVNRDDRMMKLVNELEASGLRSSLLLAELTGFGSIDRIAMSQIARLGLIEISLSRGGEPKIDLSDVLSNVLSRVPTSDDDLIEGLVGSRAIPMLTVEDFVEQAEPIDLIRRMLAGALESGVVGVNILLYGPPGTGKTELAKVLAAASGAVMYAVGEVDDDGNEPNRFERVTALKLAQRVLATRRDAVLLFDEMEDLIGNVERGTGGYFSQRDGSKIFINRLLETNPVATVWTSNTIDNVDAAFLRRMSYVMHLDVPPRSTRVRIIHQIAEAEGVALSKDAVESLADAGAESACVARTTLRTVRLAGGGGADANRVMTSLITGMRYGRRVIPQRQHARSLDLDLYNARPEIPDLVRRISAPGAPSNFTLLMSGPPGTGKTALAGHIALSLDRPLVVKRASDLLSAWIGESEQNIAKAFAEAADTGSVLLFDEIDSLLYDRSTATHGWEVSQINELLTWLDHHPMPFIAATNFASRLDPAALRRFDFKIALEPLTKEKAARAFQRFFDMEAPAGLANIDGLTPGDFAVVARQLRFGNGDADAATIMRLLSVEAAGKPHHASPIGFQLA